MLIEDALDARLWEFFGTVGQLHDQRLAGTEAAFDDGELCAHGISLGLFGCPDMQLLQARSLETTTLRGFGQQNQ